MSSRRLARCLQDVFKTFSRRLGGRKIVTLKTCWRRLQDMSRRRLHNVFKTNKCLLGDLLRTWSQQKRDHGCPCSYIWINLYRWLWTSIYRLNKIIVWHARDLQSDSGMLFSWSLNMRFPAALENKILPIK